MVEPKTRGKGRMTVAIKEAVETAFTRKNKGGRYLSRLADDHPAVFCALVAKCIPQAVAVDVHHHAVNLGLEMQRAGETLARLNAPGLIDVTPDSVAPDSVTPVIVPGEPGETGDV